MSFNNPDQTNEFVFSTKSSKINHPSILLKKSQVNNIQVHNYVELIFASLFFQSKGERL